VVDAAAQAAVCALFTRQRHELISLDASATKVARAALASVTLVVAATTAWSAAVNAEVAEVHAALIVV